MISFCVFSKIRDFYQKSGLVLKSNEAYSSLISIAVGLQYLDILLYNSNKVEISIELLLFLMLNNSTLMIIINHNELFNNYSLQNYSEVRDYADNLEILWKPVS